MTSTVSKLEEKSPKCGLKFNKEVETSEYNQTEILEMTEILIKYKPYQIELLTDKTVQKNEFQERRTK